MIISMKRLVIVLFIFLIGGIWYFIIDPIQFKFSPRCLFKLITGLDCPGCGMQRALHAFLQGHFKEAVQYNYHLIISVPYALFFLMEWLLPSSDAKEQIKIWIENRKVVSFFVTSVFIWFIVRNIYNI